MNTFTQIWNNALEEENPRKYEPRDYLWASDLGKSNIDIYLSLKGEEPSNFANARLKRKFEAGNMWEWILGLVMRRSGLMTSAQGNTEHQYEGLMKVTGRYDFIGGGKAELERGLKEIELLELPDFLTKASQNLVAEFSQYEFPEVIFEMKTVSSFIFDKLSTTQVPLDNHKLQLAHYLVATGMSEGHIVYISKDDCRLLEFPVFREEVEEIYRNRVEEITEVMSSDKLPKLEPVILYDGKFSINWKVGYSPYLSKLYGYEQQMDYENDVRPKIARWNRVVSRVAVGKKMTKANEEILLELEKEYPEIYKYLLNKINEYN